MTLGGNYGGLIVKIKTNTGVTALLDDLRAKWNSFSPQGPFSYTFLNDKFAALYASELRTQKIFSVFAVLAIVIASLGLFGLSAFSIEQRTKEIGIRKVLGASVGSVVYLFSKEFIVLIGIAFAIATPVAWYFMHKWLQDFAYRVSISWWILFISGVLALLIAVLTVGFQAIKAGTANPVKSLRTE